MDTPTPFAVGPFVLRRQPDGTLQAEHQAMRDPVPVSERQLVSWLLRHARASLDVSGNLPQTAGRIGE